MKQDYKTIVLLNKILKKDYIFLFEFLLFASAWLFILFYLNRTLSLFIDSDSASELLLSRILCNEHKLLTNSWVYSSELRVFNTQIVYSFFFIFFKKWHTVRMASAVVFHILLFLCVIFLCKQIQPKNNHYLLVCFVMLLPFTRWYIKTIICESYYIPHVTINFVILGLLYFYVYRSNNKRNKIIALVISSFLSFISGLGGIRQIVITFLPLLIASIVFLLFEIYFKGNEKSKIHMYLSQVKFSFIMFVTNALGYLVNSRILSKKYYFYSWEEISFTSFNRDAVARIFDDFLIYFGYGVERIAIDSLFKNALSIFMILSLIIFIIHGFKKESTVEYKFMVCFFLMNIIVFISIYAFTSMHYTFRYVIPSLIMSNLLGYLFLFEAKIKNYPEKINVVITIALILLMSVRSVLCFKNEFRSLSSNTVRQDLLKVTDYLYESDYNAGFATFWNSNIVVELTDGKVSMFTWCSSGGDGSSFTSQTDPRTLYEWLLPTNNIYNPPSGKVFVLYRDIEIPYCNWKDKLNDKDIVFKTPSYIVYGYKDYQTMLNALGF